MADPHWTTYLAALLTPTVAVFGLVIAYRQFRTARNKLKLDLFDRRYVVYAAVRELFSSIITTGKTSPAQESSYLIGIRGARWLFGAEVRKYLEEEVWPRIVDLGMYQSQVATPASQEERSEAIKRQAETKKWILSQLNAMDELFAKYLALQH